MLCSRSDVRIARPGSLARLLIVSIVLVAILGGLAIAPVWAETVPVLTSSGASATFVEDAGAVAVDPGITLTGPDIDGAKVMISGGFISGQDWLDYTAPNSIGGSFDSTKGILTLSGTATAAEYQAALRAVRYRNSSHTPNTSARTVSFSLGLNSLYNANNGHFYEEVNVGANIAWTSARDAAAARTYYGLRGYLVTVTSDAEQAFCSTKITGQGWLGASDAGHEGQWYWVTGPEGAENGGAGRYFSDQHKTDTCGATTGTPVNGYYQHWASGEPNNCGSWNAGAEDYAHFLDGGYWNDFPDSNNVQRYVVEYGGMAGDPTPQVTAQTTVHVTAANDAPSFNSSYTLTLTTIPEDTTGGSGNTVASIVPAAAIADLDGVSQSIAVIGQDTSNGVWQYSTDGGSAWSDLPVDLATERAVLLGSAARLRFIPTSYWHGTATVTLRAWDGSSGTNGQVGVDTTTNGGSTAFSANTATASITVYHVNHAPTLWEFGRIIYEDNTYTFDGSEFVGCFNDADAGDALVKVKITSLPAHGTLKLGGTAVSANQEIARAGLGALTFTPEANWSGETGFGWNGSDGTAYADTIVLGVMFVTAVNDAPGFTMGPNQSVLEDCGAQSVAGWATGINAGATDEATQALTFHVTNDNNSLFSVQPKVQTDGSLTYTPAADASGTATVSLSLHDDGGTGNGGADTSITRTFTIDVTAVNDAPGFNKGAGQTALEDWGAQAVANWATGISKGPADEAGQTLSFVVTNTAVALFSVQPAVAVDGALTYTPAANANGTATVYVYLHDSGGTANGGVDRSATQTFTIQVTAVNDAPGFTRGSDRAVLEDSGAQTVAGWATAISRGAANESAQTLGFVVTNDNNSLFAAQPKVAPDGTLTYEPAPDANGTAIVTLYLHDDGGTANGGADTSAAQTFTIDVTAVNDAPGFTRGAGQDVQEDCGLQSVASWATGISAGPANEAAQTFGFVVTNDNHSLFVLQPAVGADGTLTYAPGANAHGRATVTVYLHDNGGTANGGIDSSAPVTFTVDVASVNDAPALANPNVALTGIDEDERDAAGDTVASILASAGWSDADDSDMPGLAVTSAPGTNGEWQYSEDGGTSWYSLAGTTQASARLLGATARIRFVPGLHFSGSVELTFRGWDQTTGTAGGTADATSRGGSTAFSALAGTASIDVLRRSPGLVVTKQVAAVNSGLPAAVAYVDDIVTYQVVVANVGPGVAYHVNVNDLLPSAMSYRAGSSDASWPLGVSTAEPVVAGPALRWPLDATLRGGEQIVLRYSVQLSNAFTGSAVLTNQAQGAGRYSDGSSIAPDSGETGDTDLDDTAAASITAVKPVGTLTVGNEATGCAGWDYAYVILYTNSTPITLTEARLLLDIPGEALIQVAGTSGDLQDGPGAAQMRWVLGTLGVGQTVERKITLHYFSSLPNLAVRSLGVTVQSHQTDDHYRRADIELHRDGPCAPEADPKGTPTPTATADPSVTPTPTATTDPAATPTLTPTATADPDVTPTPTATVDPTATPAATIDPNATPVATVDPNATPAATPTPTVEPTDEPGKGRIRVYVWNDLDGDGEPDDSEPPLEGVQVDLFAGQPQNGRAHAADETPLQTLFTDAQGVVVFRNLEPGTYYVEETLPQGYAPTTQTAHPVTVQPGTTTPAQGGARTGTQANGYRAFLPYVGRAWQGGIDGALLNRR